MVPAHGGFGEPYRGLSGAGLAGAGLGAAGASSRRV